ncbi:TetR/AcrR family transcriptional regulator C-terminal domain-containing protein [Frigoribacterium faeni]|jgi:AcrR family transcriptional regulator|uniref:TetR/AcrR family transcriptional regulator C-terminal domain-containing protein n=1 Tax=Frigoribacterium faeni TaxID=145483 RepID=UPI00141A96E0|nr:TetR/AcrR family transcriptional regulator C-terminal domain-containing protein [Frigoribacterium faeni]NIJ05797.1 AcrR family transcriptional regulator [Frigoribacterium faeni]
MASATGSGTARGAATRARILAATAGLLSASEPRGITVSEIARAAGAYPNQITHHFGSKDRLVLDAAFALLLRDTTRLQAAGRRATDVGQFREVLARTALAMPATVIVVQALARAGDDAPQRERVRLLLAVLFRQSERYLERVTRERDWTSASGVGRDARTFWSAVFGATLLASAGVTGGPSDLDLAATLSIADPS